VCSTASMNLNTPTPVPRRNSLRLPPQPPHIPVPPSLKQSPYLNAPIFKCEVPSPRLPSEEDERWLQDTVPINSEGGDSAKANFDRRRGSIVQPSRYSPCQSGFSYPTSSSTPVSPATDSTPSSPSSAPSRAQSQTTKYLSHSLAPPPQPPLLDWHSKSFDSRPHLCQAHSEPNILRRAETH